MQDFCLPDSLSGHMGIGCELAAVVKLKLVLGICRGRRRGLKLICLTPFKKIEENLRKMWEDWVEYMGGSDGSEGGSRGAYTPGTAPGTTISFFQRGDSM